jgi:hypothetical protein
MKHCIAALMLIFTVISLPAEKMITKEDFLPPPPLEQPLLELVPGRINPETGIWISTAGILTGMALSLITTHSSLNLIMENPSNPRVQQNIALTGACLIGTAVCTVLLDLFLDKREESKKLLQ